MFSPEASTWKGRLRVPLVDRIHCSGFPDGADDGVRTRGLLLGKQACCHCTTSALRGVGFEPATSRSWAWRAAELPYPAWPRFPGDAARQGRVPDGPQGAVPGRRREGARVCGPTVAAKHAMEESNLRGRFWRPSDCHCPNGVLCFPLFDCQTSPPASGVRPRAAACDGMRPRRGGHPLYGVSHLMGELDAGRRDDQEHAYRQACPERPCDPQYPQYGLHSEPQPPVDGGRAQKREHPEQRHLQGRLPSCGNHDRPLSP